METKYKLTSKTDANITKICTYVEADAPTETDPKRYAVFQDETGEKFKFENPDMNESTLFNADWSIEQLPFDKPAE